MNCELGTPPSPWRSHHCQASRLGDRQQPLAEYVAERLVIVGRLRAAGRPSIPTILEPVGGSSRRTGLVNNSYSRYLVEMARNPQSRRRSNSNARPFFELVEQMESLLVTIKLDWPDDMRADAQRRLARIARALRYAPETSGRMPDV